MEATKSVSGILIEETMAARIFRTMRFAVVVGIVGLGVFLAAGNVAIFSIHLWARGTSSTQVAEPVGIDNFRIVDERLYRGAAPSTSGYESLAALGVTTVVDLRAEEDIRVDDKLLARLGITRIRMPVRDGQTPPPDYVDRFLQIVSDSQGVTFVHCGAGVGRTGTMAAAYLVRTGEASPSGALRRNLEVGPPSLEQVAYVTGIAPDGMADDAVTAMSRVLDAPRRIWSRISH